MRGFQTASSCLSTVTAMEGLQVAPTAPCEMEYVSSSIEAESFQRQVGVVWVILWSGLLYRVIWATDGLHPPGDANVCRETLPPEKVYGQGGRDGKLFHG